MPRLPRQPATPSEWHGVNYGSPQWANLVGWWPTLGSLGALPGVLMDLAGGGGVGSLAASGSPALSTPSPVLGIGVSLGPPSNSLYGSDGLLPSGSADRTMAVWLRPDATITDDRYVFTYGTLAAFQASAIGIYSGQWFFSNFGAAVFATTTAPVIHELTHVVYTLKSGTEALYVNGIPQSLSGGATGTNTVLSMLDLTCTGYHPMSATVFDARVYDRALTAVEVAALYDPMTRFDLYAKPRARSRGPFSSGFSPAWVRRQQLIGSGVY